MPPSRGRLPVWVRRSEIGSLSQPDFHGSHGESPIDPVCPMCYDFPFAATQDQLDDLPKMRKESRAPLPPVVTGLGRELALAETLSLSRLRTPLLRLPRRRRVTETSDSGRKAHHEIAPDYSLAAYPGRIHPVRHQFVDLPGYSLLPCSATHRHRGLAAGRKGVNR